jgi:hypothetical protein
VKTGSSEKRREEKRREEKRRCETLYLGWGQETLFPAVKVPRQCPFVLLVDVMHMIEINF